MKTINDIPHSEYCLKSSRIRGKFVLLNELKISQFNRCLLLHRKPLEFFDALEERTHVETEEGVYTLSDKPGWHSGVCVNPVIYSEYLQTNI